MEAQILVGRQAAAFNRLCSDVGEGRGRPYCPNAGEGLLLPEDVHAFEEGSEKSVARRLEWHAIAVIT